VPQDTGCGAGKIRSIAALLTRTGLQIHRYEKRISDERTMENHP
jgi:hypothetical protein